MIKVRGEQTKTGRSRSEEILAIQYRTRTNKIFKIYQFGPLASSRKLLPKNSLADMSADTLGITVKDRLGFNLI